MRESSDQTYVNFLSFDDFFFLFKKLGRFGRVIIVSKDGEENLLRTAVWKELRMLDDIIQNTTVDFDGDTFTYRQICARWENECYSNDILNLDYILPEASHQSANYFYCLDLNFFKALKIIDKVAIFSNVYFSLRYSFVITVTLLSIKG